MMSYRSSNFLSAFTYFFYLVLDTPVLQLQGLKIHTDLANKSGIITSQTCPLQATVATGAALLHCARRHSRQAVRRRTGRGGGHDAPCIKVCSLNLF